MAHEFITVKGAKENNLKVDWNVNTKNTKLHSVGLAVQNNEQYICRFYI